MDFSPTLSLKQRSSTTVFFVLCVVAVSLLEEPSNAAVRRLGSQHEGFFSVAAPALHSEITQVLKLLTALKEKTSKGLSDLFAEEPESSFLPPLLRSPARRSLLICFLCDPGH